MSIITFVIENRVTEIWVIDEMLIDLIKNNSNEMRNIHNDKSKHSDSIDNSHNFIGIDFGIDNTEKIINLYDF